MMIDEFTYPPRVQEALDFVENATMEQFRRDRARQRYRDNDWRVDNVLTERQRKAVIEAKNAERRRKQIEAQQAKQARRVTPPTS
jgi:hypothetical protein